MGHEFVALLGGGIKRQGVVDRVGHGIGLARIGPVDRARRRIDEVPDAKFPRRLDHVEKPDEIGADVVGGCLQGMAHARLGGEMGDMLRAQPREQAVHSVPVSDIPVHHFEGGMLHELCNTGLLEGDIIIGVEIVEAHHAAPAFQQAAGEVKADEPGRSRHHDGCLS